MTDEELTGIALAAVDGYRESLRGLSRGPAWTRSFEPLPRRERHRDAAKRLRRRAQIRFERFIELTQVFDTDHDPERPVN